MASLMSEARRAVAENYVDLRQVFGEDFKGHRKSVDEVLKGARAKGLATPDSCLFRIFDAAKPQGFKIKIG